MKRGGWVGGERMVWLNQQLHGIEETAWGQLDLHREGKHKLLSHESFTCQFAARKWVVMKATIAEVDL